MAMGPKILGTIPTKLAPPVDRRNKARQETSDDWDRVADAFLTLGPNETLVIEMPAQTNNRQTNRQNVFGALVRRIIPLTVRQIGNTRFYITKEDK